MSDEDSAASPTSAVSIFTFDKVKPTQYCLTHTAGRPGHDLTVEEVTTILGAPLDIFIQTDGRWRVDGSARNKYGRVIVWPDASADISVARWDNGWVFRRSKI